MPCRLHNPLPASCDNSACGMPTLSRLAHHLRLKFLHGTACRHTSSEREYTGHLALASPLLQR